ncbi:hypothetical protein JBL43_09110 [Aureibaculum sp. A20]|uniref:Uncharacterized protein n=1 Tax=Aureibaculum flavum TaxID=2795986 RepID=A0ABS0WR29_9FLAO|nr:hypothetical protein [Aureibaculum flavum]MBJ2174394.1 hypothetical protein [Aureibaculum flavum]
MRDSYQKFFEHFKIDFSDIIEFGIEIDTIYPDPKKVKNEWIELINSIENNEDVYIRGYGRDAHGTAMYQELYKILLNNENIKKDASNNDKPTRLLQNITNYSKTIKKDSLNKERINNYQVSHIFGRTKKPFLFTAPWNIVWKSKLLDPLTGHESRGENTNKYKKAFLEKSSKMYSEYIYEYNQFVKKYFLNDNLEKAFIQMSINNSNMNEKTFNKFKIDAINELKPIEYSKMK